MNIAFLILCHKNLESVYRLSNILHSSAGDNTVEVFVHIDKKTPVSSLDFERIGSVAHILQNPLPCELDNKSIVEAEMMLINHAYEYANFDYFALLSGQDYPIKRVSELCNSLEKYEPKSIIDIVPYETNNFVFFKFNVSPWYKKINTIINNRFKAKTLARCIKVPILLVDYLVIQGFKTLNKELRKNGIIPYGGCQWWILNKNAIEDIMTFIDNNKVVYDLMMNKSFTPEETVIQTIVMNTPSKNKIVTEGMEGKPRKCGTFVDFGASKGRQIQAHPYILTIGDCDIITRANQEGYFFARKFDESIDSAILDYIDNKYMES